MKLTNLKVTAIAVTSLIVFGFAGCQQNANKNEPVANNAKSTDLIKFNITENTQYLATQFAAGTLESNKNKKPNSGTINNEDTLLSVVIGESNELKEEKVIEIPKEKYQLADSCEPQPVLEVYKCPYPKVEEEAKGVYIVFDDKIDSWEYTDGTKAPNVGQIIYVKPDGTNVDIFNDKGNVNKRAATWLKENSGDNYIQFDMNGNIFILAKDYNENKFIIYRYNPLNDKITKYTPDIQNLFDITSFTVRKDGSWIFMTTNVDNTYNNVYAMDVNGSKTVPLFESSNLKRKNAENQEFLQVVLSVVGISPTSNIAYWFVNEFDNGGLKSGLYAVEPKDNGASYYEKDVQRYYSPWDSYLFEQFGRFVFGLDSEGNKKAILDNDSPKDYTGLLTYMKSLCYCDGEIEFNLSWFKDKTELEIIDWEGKAAKKDYSMLYAEDANNQPLKNEEALKYLCETKTANWDGSESNLYWTFVEFIKDYWIKEAGRGAGEVYKLGYAQNRFPFELVLFKKGTTESAFTVAGSDHEKYLKSDYAGSDKGIILFNDEGIWVHYDVWNPDSTNNTDVYTHASIFNLTDSKGNFTLTSPGDLNDYQFYHSYTGITRDKTDPWYKKPFATNINGFAAISKDQKTIYYHSSGETKDLLEKDSNKDSIGTIYSFSLDDEKLIYNAVKTNGGYMMVSIDLATGEATKLPIEKQLECMLSL